MSTDNKREIKFRFWTPDKRMIEDHEGWVENIGINEAISLSQGYGYKIMQYTGLKDRLLNEIWEGDILKRLDVLLTVWFNESTASFDVLFYGDETGDTESLYSQIENGNSLEVIGNIYENKNLPNG